MPRIQGVDPATVDGELGTLIAGQRRKWGQPLGPYLLYARRPAIFRGAMAMWGAVHGCHLLDAALCALVNRRVAFLNGCEF